MKVSIQIPVYNNVSFLEEALESIKRQTYDDYEIIVVNDGSKEDVEKIVEKYPKVTFFRQNHLGVSAARNLALKASKGDLIAFLDADDLWTPEKLRKQVAYLELHPECDIIFAETSNFTHLVPEKMSFRQKQLYQTQIKSCLVSSCVRKTVFETYGTFRTEYEYGEDTELMARLAAAGVSMTHCLEETMYLRRVHDENMSLVHEKVGKNEYLGMLASAFRQAKRKSEE